MTKKFNIGSTPAILIGEQSEKVFLYMHGLHGNKEEALAFAEVAVPMGFQVLGIDLKVDGKPWNVMPLYAEVRDYVYSHWKSVSVRANSIGSWFTLMTFQGFEVEKALLVSPLLDMKKFIEEMPSRENDYYDWVVKNPVTEWNAPTFILRPEVDLVVSESSVHDFINQHNCHLTVFPGGEHWFHTPEQLEFLKAWEKDCILHRISERKE